MSDNSQFKEINQQKLQEILTQENRTAVELDTATTFQNPEFYSMERTIEDNRFITDVLSKMEVGELQLTEEQKVNLLNKKSRNQSHILVNQQKFTGDSTLMRRVKEQVLKIEKLLKDDSDNSITLQFLREAYSNAIKACEDYCAKKNPYFAKGKARKRMVQEQLDTLKKEQILLDNALTAVENGEIERPKTIRDLIEQGYALEEQKKSPKKTVAEEKKDEVIEEKQEEKEIKEVTTEVTEEKQTEEKKEVEKPVVVEKTKEEMAKEKEERKKEVNASMLEKLKNIPKVSQAKIDEANKVMEDSRTELKKYVKEPTEHIKTKVMDGNTKLLEKIDNLWEEHVDYIGEVSRDKKTGQVTLGHFYPGDFRKEWREANKSNNGAFRFDEYKKLAKGISDNPKFLEDKEKADELISTMDALYNEVNKDCPLIQADELEAIINKLNSKSYIEQKQAYSFLQNYIQAIEKWDVDTKKKLGNKGSHDMSYDMEQIYKALHLMLTYYGEANPLIAQMTEEEVAAYEEYMETPEQKEEKRRKKAEEANAAASRRGERMMDAISLESVKGKKATDEIDKAMEKRQERIKEEERIKKEEEERRIAEEKRIKEEEERRKEEEKRKKEEEERRKEEERRIEEERQREEARKTEVAKRIKEEQKRRAEEEEKLRRKEEEDYQKEKLAQVQINEGLLVYEKYQEMVKRLCKNGTVNFRAADKEKDLSETEKVLLPLMSEQGCTWDVLMNAARMGAYAAKYYEGDYTKIPSMGYKMAFELLYTLISDLLGGQENYELDGFHMFNYIPKPEAVANMKLKIKENGLVVLPEEARVRVAGIMKYFEDQEKKVMGSSGYKDLMENMFTNYFKEVREAGGFLPSEDVDIVMGRDYIGMNFLHDKMKEMAPDILRKHPELAG